VAGAVAAGCGRGWEEGRSGVVTLTFYTYASSNFFKLYNGVLIPRFEREHPGIRIRVINNFDSAGYNSKLLTLIAGGMAPDVFHCTQENFPSYAAKDILLPLDGVAAGDGSFRMDELYPRVVDAMRNGRGELVGLPSDFSTIVMFYNKELFDRGGVAYPDPDWTWGEFLETCRRLTVPPDVFATSNSDAYNRWPAWVWMNGGNVFAPDMSRCTMDEPASVEGLRFYVDLSARHRVARTPGGSGFGLSELELFTAQKTAVYAGSRYAYKNYLETMPLRFGWDCVPLPRGPAGRYTTFLWGGNCIMKGTRHPREAWEFVKFMSGPAGAEIMVDGGNGMSPHRPTIERAVARPRNPGTPKNDRLFLEAIDYARQAPVPTRYALFADANLAIRDAFDGRMSVEAVCRRYTDEVNELLRGARL
jgi:multiple sugar transport system substrate-binding protein